MMKHFLTENLTENLTANLTEKTTNFSRIQSRFYGTSAATSLTGSPVFWPLLLLLSACGGGGGGGGGGGPTTSGTATAPETAPAQEPKPAQEPASAPAQANKQGYVYDGPIVGAVVWVDVDGDGVLDKSIDAHVGKTNKQGWFEGKVGTQNENKRYIVDLTKAMDLGADGQVGGSGENEDRKMSEYGVWLAPEGATVISAFTHLLATEVLTLAEINSALPGFNPLTENPYNHNAAFYALNPQKKIVHEQARTALPRLTKAILDNEKATKANAQKIQTNAEKIQNLED